MITEITREQASILAKECYGILGMASRLPGEMDMNFKLQCNDNGKFYLLKISYPNPDEAYMEFQEALHNHLFTSPFLNAAPKFIQNNEGNFRSKLS